MPESELPLVLAAVAGSTEAFGALADRYTPVLLGLAYSLTGDLETARDIAQEALLKAYTALATLQRPDRFGSWLRQIAANLARTHLRDAGRHPQVPLADTPEPGTPVLEQSLDRQDLLRTLQAVPEGPRAAVVLHYLVGLPPTEAARRLGISRAAFDTRLSRGREALRKELTQRMDEAMNHAQQQVATYLSGITERVKQSLQAEQRERVTATKELALLAARANLPRLIRDLRGHDEGVRKQTAQLLGDTLDPRAIPPLLEALPCEVEAAVQAEICRSLARLGAVEATPALQTLARNTADMTVHKAADDAVKALQDATPTSDIAVEIKDLKAAGIEALFLDLLRDESPAVRVQAADGLGRVESTKAVPDLLQVLQADAQTYVRRAAAEALGAVSPTPAQRGKVVQALTAALSDPDMTVQAEAAWSLSLITPPNLRQQVMTAFHPVLAAAATGCPGPWFVTFPALAGALGGPEDRVQIAQLLLTSQARWKGPLTEALLQLSRPGETAGNELLRQAVQAKVDPRCEWKLVKALGRTLDPAVLPDLQAALSHQSANVREAAAEAIAAYPGGQELLQAAVAAGTEPLAVSAAPFLTDAAFLEATADRLSPKGRVVLQAAAKRLTARA